VFVAVRHKVELCASSFSFVDLFFILIQTRL
jgi:hypothetical protein